MRRLLAAVLFAAPVLDAAAADPADERAKLQGVWHSIPGTKRPMRVIFLGDKAGYALGDVAAKTPPPGAAFVGLAEATLGEAGGKTYAELVIVKDVTRKLEYRFVRDRLVVGLDKAEYSLLRVNTRAGDPEAKPLAGTWTITEVGAKGKTAPGKAAGFESLSFAGDKYVLRGTGGKELLNSFYRVGPETDGRAELDVYGLKADPSSKALIEVKGDDLTLAQPIRPGDPRPTGFDTAKADTFLIRAARAK